ncbi:MAG TPA: RNA polymerase sigma factor [Opitutaceae bacterium]|jgi:RNA polymerase sigma-70 factor (ECF subfamily)|nr:RNA polymerase sigma factor [Opitutaceae bacterium]
MTATETFGRVVEAHYASLYRFALSLARNEPDAADLVQQTYFIWATKGDSLHDAGAAKSWLFTTLYREFLRAKRRGARASSLESLPGGEAEIAAEDVDRASRCDSRTAVAALQAVDETFRAPLTLFYLEELSYQEIAAVLEVPIGTVMSRLSRGKAQLRGLLSGAEAPNRVVPFPGERKPA